MIQNTADGIVVRNGGKLTVNGGIIHSTANNAVSINGSDTAAGWETPIESQATINGGYRTPVSTASASTATARSSMWRAA